jgi:hypothetical protein
VFDYSRPARAFAQGVKLGRPKIDSATERKVRKQTSLSLPAFRECRHRSLARVGVTMGRPAVVAITVGKRPKHGDPTGEQSKTINKDPEIGLGDG